MKRNIWLIVIVFVVLVVGGLIFWVSSDGNSRINAKFKEHGKHAPSISKGSSDNTIYIFADFSCPYCKTFEEDILPEVKDKYVDNKKANIKFINAALLGDDSVYQSVVSYAILEEYPNKYWDFNKYMYKLQSTLAQEKTNIDSTSKSKVEKILKNTTQQKNVEKAMTQSGLSPNEIKNVNAAVKNHKSSAWKYAIKDRDFAKNIEIKSIPSVYINGEKVEDYRDVDSYIHLLK